MSVAKYKNQNNGLIILPTLVGVIGLSFCIIAGHMDLSIESVMGFAAMLAAGLADEATLAARREWYFDLLDLLRVRARTIDDIVRQAGPYFLEHIDFDPEAVAKHWKNPAEAAEVLDHTLHQ